MLTFLIGGPLLWLPVFLLIVFFISGAGSLSEPLTPSGNPFGAIALTPAIGGGLWFMLALKPSNWLFTWIPTLGSALIYSSLAPRIQQPNSESRKGRSRQIALHAALSAFISSAVYFVCVLLGGVLGLHPPMTSGLLPYNTTALQSMSKSALLQIGTVAIIGAVLGTVLGVKGVKLPVIPKALKPPDFATSDVPSQPLRPSLRQVLAIFLIGGPLLYMPLLVILMHNMIGPLSSPNHPNSLIALPLLAPIGAIAWYGSLFYPPMWLYTWIPTVITALLLWAVLSRSPMRRFAKGQNQSYFVGLIYTAISIALSLIVFGLCQGIEEIVGHGASVASQGAFSDLVGSAAGHTAMAAVAILGALLGFTVYMFETGKIWRL